MALCVRKGLVCGKQILGPPLGRQGQGDSCALADSYSVNQQITNMEGGTGSWELC